MGSRSTDTRQRRWAAPFVVTSAGPFVLGGAFDYFAAFAYGPVFRLFLTAILGIGPVFEMPALIMVILAAPITPTPDVFNPMLSAVPITLLYFAGIFAAYLLDLQREHRRFPWRRFLFWSAPSLAIVCAVAILIRYRGYHLAPRWPYQVR